MSGFNGTPSRRILDAFGLQPDSTGALVPKPHPHAMRDDPCRPRFQNTGKFRGFPPEPVVITINAVDAESVREFFHSNSANLTNSFKFLLGRT